MFINGNEEQSGYIDSASQIESQIAACNRLHSVDQRVCDWILSRVKTLTLIC